MIFCDNCGNELSDNAKFCPKCGSKLTRVSQHGKKNIFQSYWHTITKYFDFSGRASLREYWCFWLVDIIIIIGLAIISAFLGIDDESGDSVLTGLYQLVIFIPTLAVGVRRMHDVSKSGWYLLVPIYNIFLLLTGGDVTSNKYGSAPTV